MTGYEIEKLQEQDLFGLLPKDFSKKGCCGKEYWKWEEEVDKYLKSQGFEVIRWITLDGDSFGPLVRGVIVEKNGVTEKYSYG